MFAIKCGDATHHSHSEHHWACPTSFAIGKHHSKRPHLSGRQMWSFCCERVTKRSKIEVRVSKSSVRSVRQIGIHFRIFILSFTLTKTKEIKINVTDETVLPIILLFTM